MRTIHLIYTVPKPKNVFLKMIDYFLRKGFFIPPMHRWGSFSKIDWPDPIFAPHSITFNLLNALKKENKVKLYDLREKTVCKMKKDDILLFHPQPYTENGIWTKPNPQSISWKTVISYPNNKKFIITPYNHDPRQVDWINPFLEKGVNGLIAIGGNYWTDTMYLSPLQIDTKNTIGINMCIDPKKYPLVKKRFNPKGQRKYLYIGGTKFYKNTAQLEAIAEAIPNFQGGYISRGNIKGWKKIADLVSLTPEYMSKLAEEYDIFVNTSDFDAQATTILEQMCFGLYIACTFESGYKYDSITKLSTSDTEYNKKQLEKLQTIDESILIENTRKNRDYAIRFHNWELFCSKVINFIYERTTKS